MRICLHVHPSGRSFGGADILAAHLAALLRAEHDVEIVHHRPWLDLPALEAFAGVDLAGVRARAVERRSTYFYTLSLNPITMYSAPLSWGRELAGDADTFITITHELPPFNAAATGIAIVLFPMASPLETWPLARATNRQHLRSQLSSVFYRRRYARLWNGYQHVIAISNFSADWVRRRFQVPCDVLYPIVDCPTPPAHRTNRVVTLGRFSVSGVVKEQLAMASAFSRSANQLAGWTFVAIGEARTPDEISYARRVEDQGEQIAVRLNAARKEVVAELAGARVFWHAAGLSADPATHPEQMEHFGIATVEAMANGAVPIVIGRGGQPEIIEDGRNGFLCQSLDDMVSRTADLAADEALWARMSSAARTRARSFGPDAFAARLRQLVPSLLSRQPETAARAPDCSVVICTRNRAAALRRCLDSVAAIRFSGAWEIVIVDNASTDETPVVIADFARRAPVPVHAVREVGLGLGRARNAGVAAATGRFLAFTDDDCYPEPDWLDCAVRAFTAHPTAGVVAGRILLFDPSDAPYTIQIDTELRQVPPRSFIAPGSIQGANLVIRRSVFNAVGRFDPDFGAGTWFPCEDLELTYRASLGGFTVVYDPSLLVRHHHGRKPGPSLEALKRRYAYGRGAYYGKFLLNRRSRRTFARELYWRFRQREFRADLGSRAREFAGALFFVLLAIRRRWRPISAPVGRASNQTVGPP